MEKFEFKPGYGPNYSKFKENHPKQLREFLSRLHDLVDEYHPNIYLLDKVFKGIEYIEIGINDELNK
jgi:hypothetical protein